MLQSRRSLFLVSAASLNLLACGSGSSTDQQMQVARAMQQSMQADLTTLAAAAAELQAAAPTSAERGWDPTLDAAALAAMKTAWIKARTAYEHVEGATAPIFPDIDLAIDDRYDGFLTDLKGAGDPDPFDGEGVTGMHAIERILYSDVIPPDVVKFESTLPGYRPAAFPATAAEAAAFKTALCGRLITDTQTLLQQWTPTEIDVSGAFQGLIGLMNEQHEKVNKAATGEEESRYSQRTLADLRANLDGTTAIYGLFRDWLKSRPVDATKAGGQTGAATDAAITAGFASLRAQYTALAGDAIPAPPATWSAETPSAADLQTPFGTLFQAVAAAVDPTRDGSVVDEMNKGAVLLGIPTFAEE